MMVAASVDQHPLPKLDRLLRFSLACLATIKRMQHLSRQRVGTRFLIWTHRKKEEDEEEEEEERNAEQETPGGTPATCVRAQLGGRAEDITSRLAPVIKREGRGWSADPEGPPPGQHGHWRLSKQQSSFILRC